MKFETASIKHSTLPGPSDMASAVAGIIRQAWPGTAAAAAALEFERAAALRDEIRELRGASAPDAATSAPRRKRAGVK